MYTAWTRCRSVTGLTHIKRHISVHAYGLFRVSRTPNLHFFGLFEETIAPGGNTDTRKTYILNRERLQVFLNVKRQNQLSHCTTLKPYAAKHHARSAKRIQWSTESIYSSEISINENVIAETLVQYTLTTFHCRF